MTKGLDTATFSYDCVQSADIYPVHWHGPLPMGTGPQNKPDSFTRHRRKCGTPAAATNGAL
jgi:hypothetical protein